MEEKIIHWGILATGVIAKKFALTLSEMEKMGETVKLTAVASRTEEAEMCIRDRENTVLLWRMAKKR